MKTLTEKIKKVLFRHDFRGGCIENPYGEVTDAILKAVREALPKNHKTTFKWSYDGCGGCGECGQRIGWDMCLSDIKEKLV